MGPNLLESLCRVPHRRRSRLINLICPASSLPPSFKDP